MREARASSQVRGRAARKPASEPAVDTCVTACVTATVEAAELPDGGLWMY